MEKDNIQFLQQFFGKEKKDERMKKRNEDNNINIHKDCILQLDILQNKSKEKDNQIYILNKKYNILEKVNTELKKQVDELLLWKNDHNCGNDISIEEIKTSIKKDLDINEIPEYVEISKLNKTYNEKIIKLESDMKDMQLKSNIEDNILFKQLKHQNILLFENNEKLDLENKNIKQRLNIVENNNNDNILDTIEKDNSININSKINEALEKQKEELNIKYFNKIDSLTKIIENLQNQINNKKTKIENKGQDKYSEHNLYNSIYIYKDIKLPYQEYRASKTYRRILEEIEFNDKISDNIKYEDITKWINKNEKSNFKSIYFKKKYERCKYLLTKYKDDLIILKKIKFSLSYIANMSETKFDDWLNILDNKINSEYNSDSDESIKTTEGETVIQNCKDNQFHENREINKFIKLVHVDQK
jgi:hypothetical protein